MSNSYPYLSVARTHNVPYGEVLSLTERLDGSTTSELLRLYDLLDDNMCLPWEQATYDAWKEEMRRRTEGRGSHD